jgi:hypothetical protein
LPYGQTTAMILPNLPESHKTNSTLRILEVSTEIAG